MNIIKFESDSNIIQQLKCLNKDIKSKLEDLENKVNKRQNEINTLKFQNKEKDNIIINIKNSSMRLEIKLTNISEDLENKVNECISLNKIIENKDKLNKRLINTLMIYRYKEFNDDIKYDYNEIKQKINYLIMNLKKLLNL
jgi:hypothetical protein